MGWCARWDRHLALWTTLWLVLAIAGCGGTVDPTVDAHSDSGIDATLDAHGDTSSDRGGDLGPGDVADVPDAGDGARPCRAAADCVGHPDGNACDTATGRCVQCVASADTCPVTEHCDDESHSCVPGCRDDLGCEGIVGGDGTALARCDRAVHACVECVTHEHCGPGRLCMGAQCVAGCDELHECPTGQSCCGGGCVDTQRNIANCGLCNRACTVDHGMPACINGLCLVGACTDPFVDCDGAVSNGCESNTLTDVTNCGSCGTVCPSRANAISSCASGVCRFTCEPGFADCNGDPRDGCEVDTTSNPSHCGMCARACTFANGAGVCSGSTCMLGACMPGFGNCDGNAANGCESDSSRDVANCGGCGNACPSRANATATCSAGTCGMTCSSGFADCDGNVANGCEVNTRTSATHCGMCNNACSFANAGASCSSSSCALGTCNTGFGNCDGNAANGCEVDTRTNVNHCGGCDRPCRFAFGTAACTGSSCQLTGCNTGFANCDNNPANGCEVDTTNDVAHCGDCATVCSFPNAVPACTSSRCQIASCNTGWGNCDGNAANGCETNTNNNVNNCGGCGNACSFPNASAICSAGACTLGTCNTGYADCDGNPANGCETNLNNSLANCGVCGNACALSNANPACISGACRIASCRSGFADCNGNASDGCEANLSSVTSCRACGTVCAVANGVPTCGASGCAIAACNAGFADCNGSPVDGCETNLNSNSSCGACGIACGPGTTCSGGTCLSSCPAGTTFCSGVCANVNTDPSHCGACGAACSLANATAGCASRACTIASCNPGWGNCDGNVANGCETNINASVSHCGACGMACSFPNAAASCLSGACAIGSCNAGWGNCDGNAANGCELNLNNNVNNCGSCGRVCTIANGAAGCSGGACTVAFCNSGWGDCDGNASNGCETSLTTNGNCGACGRLCAVGNTCSGGSCVPTAPVNDLCANATAIDMSLPSQLISGDTTFANNNQTASCVCTSGKDLFYRFTLTQTEYVYADTFGLATWDTSLWFLNDSCTELSTVGHPAPEILCNDDNGGCAANGIRQSQIFAILPAGNYRMGISGCSSGAFQIRFAHFPVGADGSRGVLPVGSTTQTGTLNGGAGVVTHCGGFAGGREQSWYWLTCQDTAGGNFTASMCSSATPVWDSYIALRHSNADDVCDDDNCSFAGFARITSTTVPAGGGLHVFYVDAWSSSTLASARSYSVAITRP
jgi:hypothetical protein